MKQKKQYRRFALTVMGTYYTTKTRKQLETVVSRALSRAFPDSGFNSAVVFGTPGKLPR